MSEDFSIQDSEDLIAGFRSVTDGPQADLAAALRELSQLPSIPKNARPPMLPSQVVITTLLNKKAHKVGITTLIVIGMVATATIGAAALVGVPQPIIHFAKSSIALVQKAVETIANVVTGTSNNSSQSQNLNPGVMQPGEKTNTNSQDLTTNNSGATSETNSQTPEVPQPSPPPSKEISGVSQKPVENQGVASSPFLPLLPLLMPGLENKTESSDSSSTAPETKKPTDSLKSPSPTSEKETQSSKEPKPTPESSSQTKEPKPTPESSSQTKEPKPTPESSSQTTEPTSTESPNPSESSSESNN